MSDGLIKSIDKPLMAEMAKRKKRSESEFGLKFKTDTKPVYLN